MISSFFYLYSCPLYLCIKSRLFHGLLLLPYSLIFMPDHDDPHEGQKRLDEQRVDAYKMTTL